MSCYATMDDLCMAKNGAPFTGAENSQQIPIRLLSNFGGSSYPQKVNCLDKSSKADCKCDGLTTFRTAYNTQQNPYGSALCRNK